MNLIKKFKNYVINNYSLRYINKRKFLWKIFKHLGDKEKFIKYFEHMDNYIKGKVK